ncbi:hypothetical protein CBM2591_A190103 [Cupriavidus taiwanensis]|nr:hypothetical protein CBM2591_A190103 [Cupriavidus taiwanensis]
MGQCESSTTSAKWRSRGVRSLEVPLNTGTVGGGFSALADVCVGQATDGFHHGDGRAPDQPISTSCGGRNQRLITAYLVKYYSKGG